MPYLFEQSHFIRTPLSPKPNPRKKQQIWVTVKIFNLIISYLQIPIFGIINPYSEK